MSSSRRALVAGMGVLAAVAALVSAAPPASAEPTTTRVVSATQQDTDAGRELVVRVAGIARGFPVRVTWGDGSSTVLRTSCTTARANTRPTTCARVAKATYLTDGTYAVRVQTANRVLHRTTVVVGAVDPAVPATGWQRDMLDAVNALRAAAGARALVLCAPLNAAADAYAVVMARTGWFDHTGPDGRKPWDRMTAAGYDYSHAGENIAAGQRDVGEVMASWRDSPGHYANMISRNFTHLGVGRADSSDAFGIYWVQNFGSGGAC